MAVSETTLAKRVVRYLERLGWEVFKEVQCPRRRRVVDIYARRTQGGDVETWAIEVKTSFGLSVMEQASYWKRHAHRISVAVPRAKTKRARAFGYEVCRLLGLGVLEIGARSVAEHTQPRRFPNPRLPVLVEEQKGYTAGNADNDYWTPYKATVRALTVRVKAEAGIHLMEAVRAIDHHYKTERSAYNSLKKHLVHKRIPGIQLVWQNGEPRLYPLGHNNRSTTKRPPKR